MSKPSIFAVPSEGSSNVVSILMSVLFPAPLGPSKPNVVPCAQEKFRMIDSNERAESPRQGEDFNGFCDWVVFSMPYKVYL